MVVFLLFSCEKLTHALITMMIFDAFRCRKYAVFSMLLLLLLLDEEATCVGNLMHFRIFY